MMTSFSSIKRRPTGMNSPFGISLGVFFIMPEFVLLAVLGPLIVWIEGAITLGLLGTAGVLMLPIDKLIRRERLLP